MSKDQQKWIELQLWIENLTEYDELTIKKINGKIRIIKKSTQSLVIDTQE